MVRPGHPHLRACLSVLNLFVLGALIVLFFKCMALLLKPVNRKREGIKWGLVSYTVVMFACGTIVTGMGQNMASVSFIDNREFPGVEGVSPPGPLGYLVTACSTGKFEILPTIAALLNYWLADGLLVSRLYDPVPVFPGI